MQLFSSLTHSLKIGAAASLLCIATLPAHATECATRYFDGTNKPLPKSILWQIDSAHTGTDYLMGTFHSSQPAVLQKVNRLTPIGGKLDGIAVELLLSDPATTLTIQQALLLPPTMRLSKMIGDELFMRTMHAMRPYGITMEQVEFIRPWAAALTLSLPASEVSATMTVLDKRIEELGKNANKEVVALESAQEQMSLFASMSLDEQIVFLKETLDQHPELPQIYSRMTQLYLNEDLSGLQNFSDELEAKATDKAFYSKLMDKLLTVRNELMVKRMVPLYTKARMLVAVGALHLTGNDGLLARLEGQGYCLTPLEQQ